MSLDSFEIPHSCILLIDKPVGISSNSCLQKAKRLLGIKKMGHTGSLDPLASGMLPLCTNRATKFSDFLLNSDKTYLVTAHLGMETETGDAEGEIVLKKEVPELTEEKILSVLEFFKGTIEQIPPIYSALKYQGQPLYRIARKGKHLKSNLKLNLELKTRKITIEKIQLEKAEKNFITLRVTCSKGTYIRTLVQDIGRKLGCGAFVSYLRRENIGIFTADRMTSLESLENPGAISKNFIVLLSEIFKDYTKIDLSDAQLASLNVGKRSDFIDISSGSYALYHQGSFKGVFIPQRKKSILLI